MAGKLDELLRKDASLRTQSDYEAVLEDFFTAIGGGKLTSFVDVPPNTGNADFLVPREDHVLLVELKQIRTNDPMKTYFGQLFRFMSEKGGISLQIKGTKHAIVGKGPTHGRWLSFHDQVRPQILKHLQKANKQLAEIEPAVAMINSRVVRGIMLFNTADYNLSNDLLRVILERRMKYAWEAEHFRAIDFVIAGTIDLGMEGKHPQEAFQFARRGLDPITERAAAQIFDDWQAYIVQEIGQVAHDEFCEKARAGKVDLAASFEGKLQRRT